MAAVSASHPHRIDEARRLIGTTLVVLLILIVVLGFAALFAIEAGARGIDPKLIAAAHSREDLERLMALARIAQEQAKANADGLALLLNIVFGPVVALLGSVTGFYFGTQSRKA